MLVLDQPPLAGFSMDTTEVMGKYHYSERAISRGSVMCTHCTGHAAYPSVQDLQKREMKALRLSREIRLWRGTLLILA